MAVHRDHQEDQDISQSDATVYLSEHSLSTYRKEAVSGYRHEEIKTEAACHQKRSRFISGQHLIKDPSRLSKRLSPNIEFSSSPKKITIDYKSASNIYFNKRGKIHSRLEANQKEDQGKCWLSVDM
jgi:hypothetical protein